MIHTTKHFADFVREFPGDTVNLQLEYTHGSNHWKKLEKELEEFGDVLEQYTPHIYDLLVCIKDITVEVPGKDYATKVR